MLIEFKHPHLSTVDSNKSEAHAWPKMVGRLAHTRRVGSVAQSVRAPS